MNSFKLSASLEGHGDDVRGVAFPDSNTIYSASRDATVQQWKLVKSKPPTFKPNLVSHGSAFVNSVSYLNPSSKYPDGLVLSGGKEAIIEARIPGKSPQDSPDALLLGHTSNVCALDVSSDGKHIVSGSWDTEARLWQVGDWDTSIVLEGHEGSVWAVIFYDNEHIITGCADHTIRMFHISGKLVRNIGKAEDVVRAICRLPQRHWSQAHLASTGNDSSIQFWNINGKLLNTLQGHESFVYSLLCLPNGDLVSSSEDRTVRIWRENACIQTLTHPAISVWCVAVCPGNGDIASGASDRVIRVFSRSSERQASEETIREFENSVRSSSIPQQQVGQVNKEKLPGPEFLQQKSGTKEGQVQMIREDNGSVSAHQWSSTAQQWVNVGTVVDAVGSSGRKITYQGTDYDYVFDVDIEDGKPPLKLPFNLSQNPYEVAKKFVEQNKLPITYLDQVANFILSNTQGATIGNAVPSQPDTSISASQSAFAMSDVKILPQTQYLSITAADLQTIHKKIQELNKQLLEQGQKDLALNPSDESSLYSIIQQLEKDISPSANTVTTSKANAKTSYTDISIDIIMKIATYWPSKMRLPGLDLLRILAALSPSLVTDTGYSSASSSLTLVDHLSSSGVFDLNESVNNTMLATRILANLFNTETGRTLMGSTFQQVHALVQPLILRALSITGANRNLIVALATLYVNYAVFLASSADKASEIEAKAQKDRSNSSDDKPLVLLEDLVKLINSEKITDREALYRALVATGTLLTLGNEYQEAARELMGLNGALEKVAAKSENEKRIERIVDEIRRLV